MHRSRATQINRREFIKLAGLNLGAALAPAWFVTNLSRLALTQDGQWPGVSIGQLPAEIQNILYLTPDAALDQAGYYRLSGKDGLYEGKVTQARTRWNLEHCTKYDRLLTNFPWGIVLHWFGDRPDKNLDLDGYLRGFNGRRREDDNLISTSAHFLVGDARPTILRDDKISIVQTQAPDEDGTPFQATHLRGLSFGPHDDKKQYFVRAYYELAKQEPLVHSLLQDMYDGRWTHPNGRTIAIEISGTNFDDDFPNPQKIANTLSVIWALMRRYSIASNRLLGHHEIQMNKSDPGKQFMAVMRWLVGLKALTQTDPLMKLLVFGPYLAADGDTEAAVRRYFKLVRDYHVLISKPIQLFQWEALSQYWHVYPLLDPGVLALKPAASFITPIAGDFIKNGYDYLVPENHEGIDLHHPIPHGAARPASPADVRLIAPGMCLYLGEVKDCHEGRLAIFRHQQPDGARLLSIYGHMNELSDLAVGRLYPAGARIGQVDNQEVSCGRFLHFAIAYGAAWDLDLHDQPAIPSGAGPTWIRERYLEPVDYLKTKSVALPETYLLGGS